MYGSASKGARITTTSPTPIEFDDSVSQWERLLYAFPAEKERRSGSLRTVQSCSRMLRDCFGRAGKTPDRLSQHDVFAWAHGIGLPGREPSAVTINESIACLSFFYRFSSAWGCSW